MYRIKDFRIGDRLYHYQDSQWKYHATVTTTDTTSYGLSNRFVDGIVVVVKDGLEKSGFIASPEKMPGE